MNWGELWGLGTMLQNAASAADRHIMDRLLAPIEDPAKNSLDSLLSLQGQLILATRDGAELSARAQDFAMTRQEQFDLRAASALVAEQLQIHSEVITASAAKSVADAVSAIGEGKHPERGSVYALATIKNVSIVLIGGAAVATPAIIAALLGSPAWAAILSGSFSLVAIEAVKKNPTFVSLVAQLGARLDKMSVGELGSWLEVRGRKLAPFRSFVIANEEPLRKIAAATPELTWMLRYIDFVARKDDSVSSENSPAS